MNITNLNFIILFFLLSLIAPLVLPAFYLTFLTLFYLYMVLAEFFNLLEGFSGIVCLGLHAFVGMGGYLVAIASTNWNLPPLWSILLGGVFSFLLALATSFLISRMKGMYTAVGSLVCASALFYWFGNWTYVGGGYGLIVAAHLSDIELYYSSLLLAVISIFAIYILLKSKIGLRLKAISDDELAASTCGINIFRTKLCSWLVSSLFCGLVGSLFFIYSSFISPLAAFSFYWTLSAIASTVLGGRRTLLGPVTGAFFITLLRQFFFAQLPGLSMLAYGIIIIIMIRVFPEGIHSLLLKFKSIFF
jgi:branched-chain amino acid transport system permease protein